MIKGILYFIAVLLYCPTADKKLEDHFLVNYYLTKEEMEEKFDQHVMGRNTLQYKDKTCRVIDAFRGERAELTYDGRSTIIQWKGYADVFLPTLPLYPLPRGAFDEERVLEQEGVRTGWQYPRR